jgi:hypothetical protein
MEGLTCHRYIDTDLGQYDTERVVLMVAQSAGCLPNRLSARARSCAGSGGVMYRLPPSPF